MRILSIDPGTFDSGYVIVDETILENEHGESIKGLRLIECGIKKNDDIINDHCFIDSVGAPDKCVIEMINSQGMAVGIETFETCVWIGRFIQAWSHDRYEDMPVRVFRRDVKQQLCGSAKAKDSNIRQALIDLYGEVGTKKNKGAMYGMKSHTWPALAVIAAAQMMGKI